MKNSHRLIPGIISLVLISVAMDTVRAQSADVWANLGLGAGPTTDGTGLSGVVSLHVALRGLALSARTTANSGAPSDFGEGNLFGAASAEYYDLAGLVGYSYESGTGRFVLAAGPAFVWGRRPVGEEGCDFLGCRIIWDRLDPTAGLATEVGLYWAPLRFLGLGLSLHGNFNTEASFAGATAGLSFGKLR